MTITTARRTSVADAMLAARMHGLHTGQGVTVALIDTGVAPTPMLAATNLVIGPDFSGEGSHDGVDANGHGTHLAGIIAAAAPDARLLSLKAGAADGNTHPSHVVAAINWLVDFAPIEGVAADVLVLAYAVDADTPEAALVEAAVSRAWEAGITVVTAAGNTGEAAVAAPATVPAVITVGATDRDGLADFSTKGDARRALDIVAPGRSIISARAIGTASDAVNEAGRVGDHLVAATGTSQAAALVGAAAAVLLEGRTLTNVEVKRLLTGTATSVAGTDAGALDLAAAELAAGPAADVAPIAPREFDLNDTAQGFATNWAGTRWTGVSWAGTRWTGVSWAGTRWTGVSWAGTRWSGVSWAGTRWTGVSWAGTRWTGVSWAGVSWAGVSWAGVSWAGTRWTGVSWAGTRWTGVSWAGVSWAGVSWAGVSWA